MGIVIALLMGDHTGCVGDAVTGRKLQVPLIFFKTEYRSCRIIIEEFLEKARLAHRPLLLPHPEKLAPSSLLSLLTTSSMPLSIFFFLLYF